MKKVSMNHLDNAMEEITSQRALFWQCQERKLKRLPREWREAIDRGERLLRGAQRLKIESKVSFPSPIGRGVERTKQPERRLNADNR